jgi:hypothetical protein
MLQWCQWELKIIRTWMLNINQDFLIVVLLDLLDAKKVPSALRLFMSTHTYLEWPGLYKNTGTFWSRLKVALGPPLGDKAKTAHTNQILETGNSYGISENDTTL